VSGITIVKFPAEKPQHIDEESPTEIVERFPSNFKGNPDIIIVAQWGGKMAQKGHLKIYKKGKVETELISTNSYFEDIARRRAKQFAKEGFKCELRISKKTQVRKDILDWDVPK